MNFDLKSLKQKKLMNFDLKFQKPLYRNTAWNKSVWLGRFSEIDKPTGM